VRGAIAAPTAGLHFTEALIRNLAQAGISITQLTLHVGYATFRPVRCRDIRDHHLGEESYQLESRTVKAIEEARAGGGRVVAVGTTVVRALETAADPGGEIRPGKGRTDLLIVPGFRFKVVDGLVTNFHLPRSSLLFLVSAFAGRDLIRGAYNLAVQERFRFYSYGDAMLII
jgi:S-adenosylmethionine:tRNA ribosyltransferase-isomerase